MIRERLCQREAMLCETCGEENGNTPKERSDELEKSTPAALTRSRINIPITFSISDVLFALQEPLKAPRPARTYMRPRVRDREIKVRRFPVRRARAPPAIPAPRQPSEKPPLAPAAPGPSSVSIPSRVHRCHGGAHPAGAARHAWRCAGGGTFPPSAPDLRPSPTPGVAAPGSRSHSYTAHPTDIGFGGVWVVFFFFWKLQY